MFQENINDKDFRILLNIIHSKYGYDFSGYSKTSFKRRLLRLVNKLNLISYHELNELIVKDPDFFNIFLEEITVNITEMFRDPVFFKSLKEKVIPVLSTYPHIRIWHAGCSTGEEVYSLAILLKEAGILDRSILYATDIYNDVLESAKEGRFTLDNILESNVKYNSSGGSGNFMDYFKVKSGKAIFNEDIRNKIVFSSHNLVNDQSFNEFHLIVCRNVLIYFDKVLQERVSGAIDYLPKPIDDDLLKLKVKTFLQLYLQHKELKISKNAISAMLKALPDSLMEVNANLDILKLYPNREDFFLGGINFDNLSSLVTILDNKVCNKISMAISKVLLDNSLAKIEFNYTSETLIEVFYELRIVKTSADTALIVFRDITDLKNVENLLKKQNKYLKKQNVELENAKTTLYDDKQKILTLFDAFNESQQIAKNWKLGI